MDIKELEQIMIKNGIVLRAIPDKVVMVCEKEHIDTFPNGEIQYLDEYKREMLVMETVPDHAGKFLIESDKNTCRNIRFGSEKYYNSIEEALKSLNDK